VCRIQEFEVKDALRRMKGGNAIGPNGIPIEVWRSLGDIVIVWLIVPKHHLSGKAPNGGKASPRLEIRRKAMVMATKTQREKGGSGGEEIRRRRLEVRL
jgi:hypothetical protein